MAQMYLSDESINKMPYSLEAEQSVLGTIILDPDKIREAANEVRAEDFYLEQHQHIYEAMRDMFLANSTIDPVTLTDELVKNGVYDASGGKSYITALAQSVPSVANLHDYLRIIREKAMLRRLISVSEEIRGMAYAGEGNSADILDRAEQLIFDIAEKNETKGFSHIKDVIVANYKHLDDLIKNGTDALGTPTYFSALDKYLIGMGKSDLVLVGARPGMGKTSFVLNIASQVALKTKKTVAIFSLEMSCEQLVSRLLSSEAWIESSKMRKGTLDEKDWDKLARAAGVLAETDILIDDTAGITVTPRTARFCISVQTAWGLSVITKNTRPPDAPAPSSTASMSFPQTYVSTSPYIPLSIFPYTNIPARQTSASSANISFPTENPFFRFDIRIPARSLPPVEAFPRHISPSPTPLKIPAKTAPRNLSPPYSGTNSALRSITALETSVAAKVRIVNPLPAILRDAKSSGILSTSIDVPTPKPKSLFAISATPVSPPCTKPRGTVKLFTESAKSTLPVIHRKTSRTYPR